MQFYYGQVSAIDHEVGRLLAGLSTLGVERDTIVLFTSDHGDVLGSHCHRTKGRLRQKNAPYADAFRIPLILRSPGRVRAGQVCDALVDNVDLAPTLLELAGLPRALRMQGKSQAAWCTDGRGFERKAVYLSSHTPRWRGIWDGRWLYAPLGYQVLYDHRDDPHEQYNRFRAKAHAAQRKRLHTLMVAIAKHRDDPELVAVQRARAG